MQNKWTGILAGFALLASLAPGCAHALQYNNISYDKRQHLEAGAAIAASTSLMSQNYLAGAIIACSVGLAKEVSDYNTPDHEAEFADFMLTCAAGSLIGYSFKGLDLGFRGDVPIFGVSLEW